MITNIYKITNKLNGFVYIGQATDIHRRWIEHTKHTTVKGALDSEINSLGKENFELRLLLTCNLDDADILEVYYINKYKEAGYTLYNQVIPKLTSSQQGRLNDILIELGSDCYVLDRDSTSNNKKGIKKKVVCLDDNIVFDSVTECAKHYGISATHISAVCKGTRGSCNGLTFRHIDDNGTTIEPNMQYSHKKSSRCYIKELSLEFDSVREACEYLGIDWVNSRANISKAIHDNNITAYGYHWEDRNF